VTRAADTGIAIDESIPGERETVPSERFEVSPLSASVILVVVAASMLAAAFASSYIARGTQLSLTDWLRPRDVAGHLANTIVVLARSPAPVLLLALILERWLPVTPNQRDLTRGFWQDVGWYVADFIRDVSWVPLYLALLVWMKGRLFGNFELVPNGVLPAVIAWTVAILAWDLIGYASHVARHRYDFLWRFHAIHHSQREMNFFTQHRFHDIDVLADQTIRTIPLLALNASFSALGIFYVIALAHFRLYHSNIKSDYGVLRYVLVSPQSHRIHHARDPRQLNSNFGIFFSMWDRAFGTQYPHRDEYPDELGIEDASFPIDQGTRIRDIPRVYAAQLIYPFRRKI
jgi:sterol desaturase/sphingolipid hydroxylase (fatty acid hydroxylase superfamily)